jgi:hypothetical protein
VPLVVARTGWSGEIGFESSDDVIGKLTLAEVAVRGRERRRIDPIISVDPIR